MSIDKHFPHACQLEKGDVLAVPVGQCTLFFRINLIERDRRASTWLQAFQVPETTETISANPNTGFLSADASELCAFYADDAFYEPVAAIEPWTPGTLRFPHPQEAYSRSAGRGRSISEPLPEPLTYEKFISILADSEWRAQLPGLGVMWKRNGMGYITPALLQQAVAEGWHQDAKRRSANDVR